MLENTGFAVIKPLTKDGKPDIIKVDNIINNSRIDADGGSGDDDVDFFTTKKNISC